MPKKDWEAKLAARLDDYAKQIEKLFDKAAVEAADIGVRLDLPRLDKPFSFNDYPIAGRRINSVVRNLQYDMNAVVVSGIQAEWENSNFKMDEIAKEILDYQYKGIAFKKVPHYQKYFNNNAGALEAFKKRKMYGLSLSDRVWRYSGMFKTEIEMGLDLSIKSGLSAAETARDLKQYLREPDKLFRRVRDAHGQLHLSKKAAAYHSGRGVYRSSYKNARRLAVTEINMAYRAAEHERIQQMDFIVGIEIKLSHNHPVPDICDDLKGKYPKDFEFTGWHPHCRCYQVTILKTDEEIDADDELIREGKEPSGESVNEIDRPPQGMVDWLEDNKERIAKAKQDGTLPYFLRDNADTLARKTAGIKPLKAADLKVPAGARIKTPAI